MAIQILENTLLKLLVRRGTDSDRKQITLETGEIGYTTDTKRLYIGDGVTPGGVLVGNKWAGNAADLTTLAPVVTGDYGYDTDNHEFKICTKGTGSVANDWTTVSNLISASDRTIAINSANQIRVGKRTDAGSGGLSAGNIDFDALGNSITLDASNRVSLSSAISVDSIYQRSTDLTSYLDLPGKLKIRTVDYTFPGAAPQADTFLGYSTTDKAGKSQLTWKVPNVVHSAVAPTTAALVPVGTIVPYGSAGAGAPYGWLHCNGQAVDAVTYSELLTAIGPGYGRNFVLNTFNVPNLSSTMLYGIGDTGMPSSATTVAAGLSSGNPRLSLSASGFAFIIKAFGGVTNPTLTVTNNLSASVKAGAGQPVFDKTGTTFNPLSGEVSITRPTPGVKVITQVGGSPTFTMPGGISFVKFYVTGSGAKGGYRSGNAGATAIGYLSAAPGTVFPVKIAAPPANNEGNSSIIYVPGGGSALVTAPGGKFGTNTAPSPTIATSDYLPTETVSILGGVGNVDTNDSGEEEGNGGSSYYGNAPAYGGGQSSHSNRGVGPLPRSGVIVFEWN